jgi:hypothetical protein
VQDGDHATRDVPARVQAIEDKQQIGELLQREAQAIDSHDPRLIASMFTIDCEYMVGEARLAGRAAIVAVYEDKGGVRSRAWGVDAIEIITHLVSNVVVRLEGDTAVAESVLTGTVFGPRSGAMVMRTRNILRHDDLVRDSFGQWLIARRVQVLRWMAETAPTAFNV